MAKTQLFSLRLLGPSASFRSYHRQLVPDPSKSVQHCVKRLAAQLHCDSRISWVVSLVKTQKNKKKQRITRKLCYVTQKMLSVASGFGDLTLNWTRQVGTDIRLTESEPAIMSTRQSSSFSLGRETVYIYTHTHILTPNATAVNTGST